MCDLSQQEQYLDAQTVLTETGINAIDQEEVNIVWLLSREATPYSATKTKTKIHLFIQANEIARKFPYLLGYYDCIVIFTIVNCSTTKIFSYHISVLVYSVGTYYCTSFLSFPADIYYCCYRYYNCVQIVNYVLVVLICTTNTAKKSKYKRIKLWD